METRDAVKMQVRVQNKPLSGPTVFMMPLKDRNWKPESMPDMEFTNTVEFEVGLACSKRP